MQSLDLAVIGNSVVSALIDKNGRHVWHCHPRLDADPIFCALLAIEFAVEGWATHLSRTLLVTALLLTFGTRAVRYVLARE